MLKLIKYEFIKARTAFFALLGVAAALELYFLIALRQDDEMHVILSLVALIFCAMGLGLFALVRGVTTYSSELNRRSGWLVFMTPNTTLKIVASKFIYTFLNGLFFAALIAGVFAVDYRMTMDYYGEWESFLEGLRSMLSMQGVAVDRLVGAVVFTVACGALSILAEIALAYLSITVSCTLCRESRWRWLPSLVLFIALSWLVSWICNLFPSPVEDLLAMDEMIVDGAVRATMVVQTNIVPALMPSLLVSLATLLICMFSCAGLLKKWVNL